MYGTNSTDENCSRRSLRADSTSTRTSSTAVGALDGCQGVQGQSRQDPARENECTVLTRSTWRCGLLHTQTPSERLR